MHDQDTDIYRLFLVWLLETMYENNKPYWIAQGMKTGNWLVLDESKSKAKQQTDRSHLIL